MKRERVVAFKNIKFKTNLPYRKSIYINSNKSKSINVINFLNVNQFFSFFKKKESRVKNIQTQIEQNPNNQIHNDPFQKPMCGIQVIASFVKL